MSNKKHVKAQESLQARLDRGDVFEVGCPSREVMRHLTSSWSVLALISLQSGMHRFSELRRKIKGVSERMLSQTLAALARDGLVERHALPVVPPHVEYRLTPLGKQAARRVEALADWIEEHVGEFVQARQSHDTAKEGPLPGSGAVRRADARTLVPPAVKASSLTSVWHAQAPACITRGEVIIRHCEG